MVNQHDAQAVRLIFSMYLDGATYGEIKDVLNERGFTTAWGQPFGSNSLHSILKNPKYTGVYTYSRSAPKDVDGNGDIEALADNIRRSGLINPLTVMRTEAGELKLLAGFRRLIAAQLLGWTEIDVNIMSPADAEAALLIEISENEQRKGFTVTEIAKYGLQLEKIEKEKANIRQAEGQALGGTTAGNGRQKESCLWDYSPTSNSKRVCDSVGGKLNISGRQYERIKFIAANAPQELIDQIDSGERTIYGTYEELRAKEKTTLASVPAVPALETKPELAPKPQSDR